MERPGSDWTPTRATRQPALAIGGLLALVAAGALATAVVLKGPDESASSAAAAPAKAIATTAAAKPAPERRAAAPVCTDCGVVQSVTVVQRKGEGTGIGAVAGGVIGGVIGNQMGGGSGKQAMTVIGAVGGGVAGHEIEKRQRATTEYLVEVRMGDGSVRTLTQEQSLAVGQSVRIVDGRAVATGSPAAATRG